MHSAPLYYYGRSRGLGCTGCHGDQPFFLGRTLLALESVGGFRSALVLAFGTTQDAVARMLAIFDQFLRFSWRQRLQQGNQRHFPFAHTSSSDQT